MTLTFQFLGAARQTTGSRHLLTTPGGRVLLDCGLVQGPRKSSNEANRRFDLDVSKLDCVVLSHAHIDHSGALPRLVKEGFSGPIWSTRPTRDLCSVMLRDSAGIQASDAAWLNRRRRKDPPVEPLYDERDVERCMRLFRSVPYGERREILPGVSLLLRDAGHILGSATVELGVERDGKTVRVGFTGDHGRPGRQILRDPERFEALDYLLTESTYGDRLHPPPEDLEAELGALVREENEDGGRILIPAFAVGRTQSIVYALGRLRERGEIPTIPIFVDSPLARAATRVVASHPECFNDEVAARIREGKDPFYYEGVRYVESVEESMELNALRSPHIVVSASGMVESGRILHHLKQSAGRREDCLLFVGYQAQGTLGRRLLDGAKEARIFDEVHAFRMKVRHMSAFSSHADYRELLDHLGHLANGVRAAFVVHGEEAPAKAFAARLEKAGFRDVKVPAQGQKVAV